MSLQGAKVGQRSANNNKHSQRVPVFAEYRTWCWTYCGGLSLSVLSEARFSRSSLRCSRAEAAVFPLFTSCRYTCSVCECDRPVSCRGKAAEMNTAKENRTAAKGSKQEGNDGTLCLRPRYMTRRGPRTVMNPAWSVAASSVTHLWAKLLLKGIGTALDHHHCCSNTTHS